MAELIHSINFDVRRHTVIPPQNLHCSAHIGSTLFLVRLFIDAKCHNQVDSVDIDDTHTQRSQQKKIVGLVIFDTFLIELLIMVLIKIKTFDSS